MRVVPTRDEVFRRWLETPWSGIRRGARSAWAQYRAHTFPLTGLVVGLLVPLLGLVYDSTNGLHAFLGHLDAGNGDGGVSVRLIFLRVLSVPFAFTMLFSWLSELLGIRSWGFAPVLVLSTVLTTLIFWLAGTFWNWSRKRGATGRLLVGSAVLVTVASYAWTWRAGTEAVRQSIRNECHWKQNQVHERHPDEVPAAGVEPEFYYCYPILPGMISCEYCYLYGPLWGGGGNYLWLWNGATARQVSVLGIWNH